MNSIQTSFTTISVLALFIFSCIAYVAHAQAPASQERFAEIQTLRAERQASTSAAVQSRQAEAVELREARQASTSALRAEKRAALTEERQNRIKNTAANVDTRIRTIITRLASIIDRMEERSLILADRGADISIANTALAEARNSLADATETLDGMSLDSVLESDQPLIAWQETKVVYTDIRQSITSARDHLRAALEAMKTETGSLSVTRTRKASTTVENSL